MKVAVVPIVGQPPKIDKNEQRT